jgi:hypothetical protein
MTNNQDHWEDLSSQWENRALKHAGDATEYPGLTALKWGLGLVVVLLVLSIVGNALGVVNVYWQAEQAQVTAPARVKIITYDPQNIIAQKAFFTTTCNDMNADLGSWKTNEAAVAQLEQQIKDGIIQDPTGATLQQAESQAQGPQAAVYQAAAAYTARAQNPVYNKFIPAGYPTSIAPPADLTGWTPPTCG